MPKETDTINRASFASRENDFEKERKSTRNGGIMCDEENKLRREDDIIRKKKGKSTRDIERERTAPGAGGMRENSSSSV